jgi:hypothetical protein
MRAMLQAGVSTLLHRAVQELTQYVYCSNMRGLIVLVIQMRAAPDYANRAFI